jgi:hypothetical protein
MHVEGLFRGHAPFYGTMVDDAGLARMLEQARPLFDSTDYGHSAWFIGSEERNIPRYGGYALGYRIVANGLSRLGLHVAAAWDRPAGTSCPASSAPPGLTTRVAIPIAARYTLPSDNRYRSMASSDRIRLFSTACPSC